MTVITTCTEERPMKVLVAYASRHGATKGIAERIAMTLERNGLDVTLRQAEDAERIEDFDAFVIGSAAYAFHWLKPASELVRKHRSLLSTRPLWLFSSGPVGETSVGGEGKDPLEDARPREFTDFAPLHPRGMQVFYGAYDPDAPAVGFAEGMFERFATMIPSIKEALPTGDFRDWPAIEAWAEAIASELQPVTVRG
jgi:menaquinone-dependent protoporphyrinogen oxidase